MVLWEAVHARKIRMSLPTVTVVIPCRNEYRHIGPCLDSVLASDYPEELLEIIVSDGMSDDGTREVLRAYQARHKNIHCIDNTGRIVPTGLNEAIRQAKGEYIVRLDAHSDYARDYIRQCVQTLKATGAANVGGAWRTKASGYWQSAIALGFHSPFSAGGARSRDLDYDGPVDTVIYGTWQRATLMGIGLFDEELVRNQDDELNLRLRLANHLIWQSPNIKSWYQPRRSLSALWSQYAQYGYWKVRVIQKHGKPASWRHLAPGIFLVTLISLALLSVVSTTALALFAVLLGTYLLASLAATLWACRQPRNWKFIPALPLVFAAYQFGYGYGFLRGLVDFWLLGRKGSRQFTLLTRR